LLYFNESNREFT